MDPTRLLLVLAGIADKNLGSDTFSFIRFRPLRWGEAASQLFDESADVIVLDVYFVVLAVENDRVLGGGAGVFLKCFYGKRTAVPSEDFEYVEQNP